MFERVAAVDGIAAIFRDPESPHDIAKVHVAWKTRLQHVSEKQAQGGQSLKPNRWAAVTVIPALADTLSTTELEVHNLVITKGSHLARQTG